ncbi:MAG: hypothetical protein ACU0DW_14045 [Shimia sp.]
MTRAMNLRSGLNVAGPSGYCIDPASVNEQRDRASVLLASCANLGAESGPAIPGLLVITASPGTLGSPEVILSAVRDEGGVLALSRTGQEGTAALHGAKSTARAVYVNMSDVSPGAPPMTDPRHWKAIMDMGGQGIVISVYGAQDGPLSGAAGEALARDAAQALLRANPAQAAQAPAALTQATATPQPGIGARISALFSR